MGYKIWWSSDGESSKRLIMKDNKTNEILYGILEKIPFEGLTEAFNQLTYQKAKYWEHNCPTFDDENPIRIPYEVTTKCGACGAEPF